MVNRRVSGYPPRNRKVDRDMSMFEPSGVDTNQIDASVRSFRRRPLLSLVFVAIFAAFAAWWFTGGSATGSDHQAEQLVISTNSQTYPGIPANLAIQSVHCTQESQGFFSRIIGLVSPGSTGSSSHPSQSPSTYYTCNGYRINGVPASWCVSYPPRDSTQLEPRVWGLQPGEACP
jgi:hypothetical protein